MNNNRCSLFSFGATIFALVVALNAWVFTISGAGRNPDIAWLNEHGLSNGVLRTGYTWLTLPGRVAAYRADPNYAKWYEDRIGSKRRKISLETTDK
jgi:hypothetical protein